MITRSGETVQQIEPVHIVAEAHEPLALVGIRDGANAKPTVQLFTPDGAPSGYAKQSWSDLSREYVNQERQALAALKGTSGIARTPRLLRDGDSYGWPFLVTEPLPASCRSLRGMSSLQIAEIAQLHPLHRHGSIRSSQQFTSMMKRFERRLGTGAAGGGLAQAAVDLAHMIIGLDVSLPIATRWHGDLVPWNAARDETGNIWIWDWETSEPDAAIGLDIVHWVLNADGVMPNQKIGGLLREGAERATPYLQAVGLTPTQRSIIIATYALTVADHGLTLATANNGWHHNRLSIESIHELLASARDMMSWVRGDP